MTKISSFPIHPEYRVENGRLFAHFLHADGQLMLKYEIPNIFKTECHEETEDYNTFLVCKMCDNCVQFDREANFFEVGMFYSQHMRECWGFIREDYSIIPTGIIIKNPNLYHYANQFFLSVEIQTELYPRLFP